MRPYHLKNEGAENGTYVRVSRTTRAASADMLKDLMLEGSGKSWDSLRYVGKTNPESEKKLISYLKEKTDRDVSRIDLINLGLLLETDGSVIPTRAFMLLADNRFPHAKTQCARFRGHERMDFVDRKEFSGPLADQMKYALDFVRLHIPVSSKITELYREDVYEVPLAAVREAIANALLHRNYETEEMVFVSVYDNRIEIDSPGTIPFGMRLESILEGRSKPRNPVIARFLKESGLVEGWGTGMRKIIALCEKHHLRKPDFLEKEDMFRVVIYRKSASCSSVPEGISDSEGKILDLLSENPAIKLNEIAKTIGKSLPTVKRSVSRLKGIGVLERIEPNGLPGGWRVLRR
jgi:predicted HTH transcriptional regulator